MHGLMECGLNGAVCWRDRTLDVMRIAIAVQSTIDIGWCQRIAFCLRLCHQNMAKPSMAIAFAIAIVSFPQIAGRRRWYAHTYFDVWSIARPSILAFKNQVLVCNFAVWVASFARFSTAQLIPGR